MDSKENLQEQLTEKLNDVFGLVFKERKAYYESGNQKPTKDSIERIVRNYVNTNTAISAGASLIPGPLGMIAAIPEIVIIIRNQVSMCYDIGLAYGQEEKLTRELLVLIFISTAGMAGIGIAVMQGSKILVKRVSLKVMQKVITLLGGKITQKLLKSMVSKWLPGIGAAAMGLWSRIETTNLSKAAIEFFSKEIEYIDEEYEILSEESPGTAKTNKITETEYNSDKIKLLCNLMKIDGKIEDQEMEFIEILLDKEKIEATCAEEIISSFTKSNSFSVDLNKYIGNPERSLSILIDMVALAKCDGKVDITEKIYIKQIGKNLEISIDDITEMLS